MNHRLHDHDFFEEKLDIYLKSLGSHKYMDLTSKSKEVEDCAICLNKFENQDNVVVFECDSMHIFHPECGSDWLKTLAVCPLCRHDFTSKILADPTNIQAIPGTMRHSLSNVHDVF
jgi:hypothetical protein